MMLMRDETSVQRIVRQSSVDTATVAKLRQQAASLAASSQPKAAPPAPRAAQAATSINRKPQPSRGPNP